LTLYVVPNSAVDLRPAGVLVVAPHAHGLQSAGFVPQVARAVPFGHIAGKLYLPVVAVLSPPVSEPELSTLLGNNFEACVWHPQAGLIGFEPGEGRSFAQLLHSPPRVESDWGHAHPGLPLNQRLRSVVPTEILDVMAIIESGRGDIGSQTDELSQLPKHPDEPGAGMLTRLGAGAMGVAAYIGLRLINLLPRGTPEGTSAGNTATAGTAGGESWVDRAAQWLGEKIQSAATKFKQASTSKRERELRRLLGLLDSDPDQGLKFALPFGGGAHRGLAPPSERLGERDVNFDLNRLHGGGPADFWDVPAQIQQQLLAEYRRLAARELRLGRHRRAAYIYAELANDVAAAAAALVAGSHFREAAVLYRDRLKNPLQAAKCLEQGRMWVEALEAYEKLEEFERAGDLANKLDQPEDAGRLYRSAVAAAQRRDDSLLAARLLESKLHAPDEALDQLLRGWKSTSQSKACIGEAYRLYGRLGRHEAARQQLERFAEPEWSPVLFHTLVDELANVAQTYPDPLVRTSAADRVVVMAATRLKYAREDESRSLLGAVRRLAPEDRLLTRDCERFLNQSSRPLRQALPATRKSQVEAVLVREWRPLEILQSVAAAAADPWFFVAGHGNDETLVLVRGCWNDPHLKHALHWPAWGTAFQARVILEPDSKSIRPVVVHLIDVPAANLSERSFPAADQSPHPVAVGSPPWATERTLAITDGGNGVFWALSRSHGTLVLDGYNTRNAPVGSQMIDLPAELQPLVELPPVLPIPIAVRDSVFYIGLGDRLVIVHRDGSTEIIDMPESICGLSCSSLHTRRRVAVTFETGGRVLWDEAPQRHAECFAMSFESPVAAFTQFGWLVAASSTECEIYSTNNRRIRLEAVCTWPHARPIAVLDTSVANEFAICFADGRVLTYRLPK
jgi:tetratricopeptide (TPR) repeat protein